MIAFRPRRLMIQLEGRPWFELTGPAGEDFRALMPLALRRCAALIEAERGRCRITSTGRRGWPFARVGVLLDGIRWHSFEAVLFAGDPAALAQVLRRVAGDLEEDRPREHRWGPADVILTACSSN
jgi:hypothetical protein